MISASFSNIFNIGSDGILLSLPLSGPPGTTVFCFRDTAAATPAAWPVTVHALGHATTEAETRLWEKQRKLKLIQIDYCFWEPIVSWSQNKQPYQPHLPFTNLFIVNLHSLCDFRQIPTATLDFQGAIMFRIAACETLSPATALEGWTSNFLGHLLCHESVQTVLGYRYAVFGDFVMLARSSSHIILSCLVPINTYKSAVVCCFMLSKMNIILISLNHL